MIRFGNEKECCGCGACAAACPKQCIQMKQGSLGHLFPEVNTELCVDCGICEKVCPMRAELLDSEAQKVYAAYAKSGQIRFDSSSGGMFATFARYLMGKGYHIYGAAFDEKLQLQCTLAENEQQLKPLMKSKYLQSNIVPKYKEIKEKLEYGQKVFIVSTPCQIAALKRYLNKEYDNLFAVDFFCHGVPSQSFFDECLAYDEQKKYKGKVLDYEFRTKKKNGSTPHYYSVTYQQNGIIKKKTDYYFDSTFYAFFQKYICLRESCYGCRFGERKRVSDITIGDFHDIDRYVGGINRFDGVSTVIVNTKKGGQVFDACSENLILHQMDVHELIRNGSCLAGGTPRPAKRDEFLQDYKKMHISALAEKYVPEKRYRKMRLYYGLPKQVRKLIIKYCGE